MNFDIDGYFGEALKKHRKYKRYTQEDLAIQAKLDRTYISMLERGIRKPSLEVAMKLAKVLNIDPTQMVEEVDRKVTESHASQKSESVPSKQE